MDPLVTVVIPTLADTGRGQFLLRAVKSALSLDVSTIVLVVVNGDRHDKRVLEAVSGAGAAIHCVHTTGVSEARRIGRERVATPLFGFLDDDDVLLPSAGTERIRHFSDHTVDMVVTNGYTVTTDGRAVPFCELPASAADGALSILHKNWLASSAAFYRTEAVTANDFRDLPNVMEWTTLGFKLALRLKIAYSAEFTYVVHQDAPNRLTRTRSYVEDVPHVLRQLRKETTRRDLSRCLDQKIRAAHHTAADHYFQQGDLGPAWRHHLASLGGAGLWKYSSLTSHLFRHHWRALRRAALVGWRPK